MIGSIIRWLSGRLQVIILLLLLATAAATLAISIRLWSLIDRASRPELSVNDVYLSPDRGVPLALVIEYQNAGRAPIRWLQILVVLLQGDMRQTLSVVRANPTPGGVTKVSVTEVKQAAQHIVLCARWLDERNDLSSSQWIYQLEPARPDSRIQRYVDPGPRERSAISESNPCAGQNS
jgi:hypothetical protein